jgi:hypothetical protein
VFVGSLDTKVAVTIIDGVAGLVGVVLAANAGANTKVLLVFQNIST